MTGSSTGGRRPVVWVGKTPVNGGGDEIYDRRLTDRLGKSVPLERLTFEPQPTGAKVAALARGVPHNRYKYTSPQMARALRQAIAKGAYPVVSWEALESLVWTIDEPVTLIVHNVMSDVLDQLYGRHPLLRWAAVQSRWWERRTYRRPNVRLVALSEHDRRLLQELAPGKDIAVAPPGTPPVIPLAEERVIGEIVLSGSYEWLPKRRDLLAVARDVAQLKGSGQAMPGWRHDLALPDLEETAELARLSSPIAAEDYGGGLRFGLIPDSFVGGFKLKSTYFIANNCVMLARCDIRDEFAGLPHYRQFVRFTPSLPDVVEVIAEFEAQAGPELFARWREFQAACAARFSWERSADLVAAVSN